MTKEEYNKLKAEIINKLGKPEYDMADPVNESAKQLKALKAQLAAETRLQNQRQATESSILAPENDKKAKYTRLAPIVVLNEDLGAFTSLEADIIKAYYLDRSLTPQQLAHQFSKSYQYVSGLFRRPEFRLLRLKYFESELGNVTQDAILQMIKHGNPQAVSMATDYLGLMKVKENKNEENRLVNPKHEYCLQLLAEWLMSEGKDDLILRKSMLM